MNYLVHFTWLKEVAIVLNLFINGWVQCLRNYKMLNIKI